MLLVKPTWATLILLAMTQHAIPVFGGYTHFTTDFPASYDTRGFDWLSRLEVFRIFDGPRKSHPVGNGFEVHWEEAHRRVSVRRAGSEIVGCDLHGISHHCFVCDARQGNSRLRVYVEDLALEDTKVLHLKADVLFHFADKTSETVVKR